MTRMADVKGLGSFLAATPDYGALGSQQIADSAREALAGIEADMNMKNALIQKRAAIETAKSKGQTDSAITSANSNMNLGNNIIQGFAGGIAQGFKSGGVFNKSKGLSPIEQQSYLGAGLDLGSWGRDFIGG